MAHMRDDLGIDRGDVRATTDGPDRGVECSRARPVARATGYFGNKGGSRKLAYRLPTAFALAPNEPETLSTWGA